MDRRKTGDEYLKMIQACEEWLRQGKTGNVTHALGKVNTAQVPREMRLALAQIARRADLFHFGLKVLRPLMPEESSRTVGLAKDEEIAEYGVLLQLIGSLTEAFRYFNMVSPQKTPKVLLYKAFCHFTRWEYSQAKPLLGAYIEAKGLTDYELLIGKVNYASCLVSTKADNAAPFLQEIIKTSQEKNYHRLNANALEMLSQISIAIGEYQHARNLLDQAAQVLSQSVAADAFYIEKWKAVAKALESGDCSDLIAFRETAFKNSQWESVRESDLYIMRVTKDESLFRFLYAGTPYPEYRKRILEHSDPRWAAPQTFELGTAGPELDLVLGRYDGREVLKPGQRPQLLLLGLFSDFYRPRKMATLFSDIFPDQAFGILSSPNRVYQAVSRTRELIEEAKIPLSIHEDEGNYRFQLAGEMRVKIEVENHMVSREDFLLRRLENEFRGREFSAREARSALDLPATSFHRLLSWGIDQGRLSKVGIGAKVRYHITHLVKENKSA